jgi:DNA-binding NarL/FixJ family response regulator
MTVIRVAIADDQELVRTGLRMLVEAEPDLSVVWEAASGREAVERAQTDQPDVILMDIRMPDLDGIAATAQIAAMPDALTRVIVLTTFDLDEYVYKALRAGASGFLLKDVPGEDLAVAIRQVARGADALLAPAVVRRLVERFVRHGPPASSVDLRELTPRELEVLTAMARGMSNAEIAVELSISETTVKTHVARVLMKLGVRDRVQAVVAAYEAGLVKASRQIQ